MKMSYPVLAHQEISAENGMVAAQHPLGAQVGLDVLRHGGNAVDAAVTTAFAMGVLQPLMNGIGGGGVMVIFLDGGGGGTVDYGMQSPGLARATCTNSRTNSSRPRSTPTGCHAVSPTPPLKTMPMSKATPP